MFASGHSPSNHKLLTKPAYSRSLFSLFYSFLSHIYAGGNLPPSITVIDMTRAGNRAARSERHPITFGGPVVIPIRLRHRFLSRGRIGEGADRSD